jgi:hypothetical protein
MKNLLKNSCDVLSDLVPHDLGESVPDVSGRGGHGAWHLSTSERRSRIASTVILARGRVAGQGAASWVAGTGILSVMKSR